MSAMELIKINKIRFIIILVSICSYLKAEASDTAGRFYFQFGVKRAWNCYFQPPESSVNCTLYEIKYFPVPGLHYGLNYSKNLFTIGIRHSINQRRTIYDENPYSCERLQDSNFRLELDSFYGKINVHSIELLLGYTFLKRTGINFNLFGFYCPRGIRGSSYTMARFYKDSIVSGFAQRKPGAVYGFGINADIDISKRIQCRLGLQFDRIGIKATSQFEDTLDPNIPRENRYNFSGKLYGFNVNMIYKI